MCSLLRVPFGALSLNVFSSTAKKKRDAVDVNFGLSVVVFFHPRF